jgi:hypothetical protein
MLNSPAPKFTSTISGSSSLAGSGTRISSFTVGPVFISVDMGISTVNPQAIVVTARTATIINSFFANIINLQNFDGNENLHGAGILSLRQDDLKNQSLNDHSVTL